MAPKQSKSKAARAPLDEAYDDRCNALSRLQDAGEDWWDGTDVVVPWAAVSKRMAGRKDTWLGTITDALEKANALDSTFTVEDPEMEDEQVVLTGWQLAGLEGFGQHDVRVQCAEIDAEVEAGPLPGAQPKPPAAVASKPRGRPKGSKNKASAGASAAVARAEAEADGVDPLGLMCDEIDGAEATSKSTGAKLRQGWKYVEYTDDLDDPHLQPERIWGGIKHPRLRRRAYDAANGKLRAIETHDATFPLVAMTEMYQQLLSYSQGNLDDGGDREPFDWQRRTGQPAPHVAELIAWYATTKIMVLARCSVLREYWDRNSESYNEQIASLFSYHRWNAILQNLHFADRASDFPCDEAGVPFDKCPADKRNWDIQGFQDILTKAWQDAADHTQNCGLDEKAYRTKSRRVPGKQRNIAKPARYFMKGFAIAASDMPIRGYVFNIVMYGGKGDGGDCEDGAKVSYVMRTVTPSMHHSNITLVYDNYYGGETPLIKLWEVGIESLCTANRTAVSHVFEKRDLGDTYKGGAKAGTVKLAPALQSGEYRTAVATIPDPRSASGEKMQARLASPPLAVAICLLA